MAGVFALACHLLVDTPATFSGTVLADPARQPIAGATVTIPQLALSVRTDSAGNFAIPSVPAGFHEVIVRAIGFQQIATRINFEVDDIVERDFRLRTSPNVLSEVEVKADASSSRSPRIAEFDERRKMGLGHFLTQSDFEKAEGRKLSDVLTSRIAGIRTVSYGSRQALISSRGLISISKMPAGDGMDRRMGATSRCYVQVIVDDIVRYRSAPDEQLLNIDTIDPSRIAAAEYYSASQTPAQFNRGGNAPCGTLVIWSRY